eukprot:1148785-Pelagomonas_calceolata.AAC.1
MKANQDWEVSTELCRPMLRHPHCPVFISQGAVTPPPSANGRSTRTADNLSQQDFQQGMAPLFCIWFSLQKISLLHAPKKRTTTEAVKARPTSKKKKDTQSLGTASCSR